ncbi:MULTISPECIES: flagellar biosynthetic protein FliR [Bacillaceae]|uniref:flagellar biosynthetic protein FliR n=1 Tax=Bacillaceae TaxID=186817 RepID=UPI001E2BCD54|nr:MULTISPECIES: flagellar biosynthetic protein FliR [Bacillaceae]MCE4048297.1 flagellar type III secretion system protein FliR [Bacillus sp. Au-Bac7]MCM3028970.1 flagellar type III secretion system protein FliR [Niallia sp. MER 6]MDL0434182.1 flagellar biosynthetic protein FliR [Niallia sp. SS-2023]UPO88941.1 flagellar type III secretion system protein FliR [Niallia sp. Man26]
MEDFLAKFPAFLLIVVRVTSFFLMLPLFSYRTIPTSHKVGFSFFLSLMMFFGMETPTLEVDGAYYLLIIKEAMVGLFIGFLAYMLFSAVQVAGGLIDFQMGFAIANVVDPQTGTQSPLTGQYLNIIALFFLLAINGHHLLLDGVFYSYQFIPLDQAWVNFGDENIMQYAGKTLALMFAIAFQMSIPVVGAIFLVDVALGIVARTVPQLNIFVVGVPVKIVVGLIMLIIVMGAIMASVSNLFSTILTTMRDMMNLMGG